MFTEEVGVSPLRVDGGAGYRARVAELVRAGQSLAWIEDGEVIFKAEIGAVSRAACQVQGVWVAPGLPRSRHRRRPGTAAVVEYARASIAPGGQPVRQRLQRARPRRLPPGRLPGGRAVRQRAVLRDDLSGPDGLTICARATRRGPRSRSLPPLIAVPLLAGCSGSAEDDVSDGGATTFLADWADGDTDAAAAAATTDPDAGHRRCSSRPPTTSPTRR